MGKRKVNAAAQGDTLQESFKLSRRYPVAGPLLQGRLGENPASGACLYSIHRMSQHINELESPTKRNSSNSNQPPSSDPPCKKKNQIVVRINRQTKGQKTRWQKRPHGSSARDAEAQSNRGPQTRDLPLRNHRFSGNLPLLHPQVQV